MDISDIVEREVTYGGQLTPVREKVLAFFQPKGWEQQSRGRRAHVSVYGKVNFLSAVLDVEMEETDWDKTPRKLTGETPFILWSSAFLDRDGRRLSGDSELFWRTTFEGLVYAVDLFLPKAWEMLSALSPASLVEEWPGPAQGPDGPPDFGPPRIRVPRPSNE